MIIWRFCRQEHAAPPLDGEGARLYGCRCNVPETAVAYTAGTLALAALEIVVHMDLNVAPKDLVSIPIGVPDGLRIEEIHTESRPTNWRKTPAPVPLQQLGAEWCQRTTSLLLRVPSVIIPEEYKYLVNPIHPDLSQLTMHKPRPFTFDPRVFR